MGQDNPSHIITPRRRQVAQGSSRSSETCPLGTCGMMLNYGLFTNTFGGQSTSKSPWLIALFCSKPPANLPVLAETHRVGLATDSCVTIWGLETVRNAAGKTDTSQNVKPQKKTKMLIFWHFFQFLCGPGRESAGNSEPPNLENLVLKFSSPEILEHEWVENSQNKN